MASNPNGVVLYISLPALALDPFFSIYLYSSYSFPTLSTSSLLRRFSSFNSMDNILNEERTRCLTTRLFGHDDALSSLLSFSSSSLALIQSSLSLSPLLVSNSTATLIMHCVCHATNKAKTKAKLPNEIRVMHGRIVCVYTLHAYRYIVYVLYTQQVNCNCSFSLFLLVT